MGTDSFRAFAALVFSCFLLHAQAREQAAQTSAESLQNPASVAAGAQRAAPFMALFGMQLGVSTMTEVEQRVAPAKLVNSHVSGQYLASLCYRSKSSIVQFMSGGVGADLKLVAFALRPVNALKDCARLPAKFAKQLRLGGLTLGMRKAEFEKILGAGVKWQDDIGYVEFEDKRGITNAELSDIVPVDKLLITVGRLKNYLDVSIALIGTFAGDKLQTLEVWKIETL